MVVARKFLSPTNFQPIPLMVKNSPRCTQLNEPFCLNSNFHMGYVEEEHNLFDKMSQRDVIVRTAIITGYNSSNQHKHAWTAFSEMHRDGVQPNAFTISAVLKACKGLKTLSCGRLAHGLAIKNGTEGSSIYVDNALMDMYATCCDSMDHARTVFEDITTKNDVSWTTLITGYTRRGDAYSALRVFRQMFLEEGEMSPFSFSIAGRACGLIGSVVLGKQVHAAVVNHGFESNLPVMNSILDMYCRCGGTSEAKQLFCEMTHRDVITWNTLIARFETLDSKESLRIFSLMVSEGFSSNCFTVTSVLAACANLAVLFCGQQLHGVIVRRGLDKDLESSNALIDMYAKCGNISDSRKIFNDMSCIDLVSWTSMMIGYGAHGHGKEVVELFNEMVKSGIKPDKIVFLAVLNACSHAGLVDEGLKYFKLMTSYYNVSPDQKIYGCVVDLLGRAGRVEEAYKLIENMPFKPDEYIWVSLLAACKAHKQPSMARLAALRVLDMKPKRAGTYVALSHMYAAEGNWDYFANLRKLMRSTKNKKEVGRSWIELKDQVFSFVVRDRFISSNDHVCEVLELLSMNMKDVGYVPDLDCIVYDSEDET